MPDKPFVINDRRKFTSEGELRPDAVHAEHDEAAQRSAPIEFKPAPAAAESTTPTHAGPQLVADESEPDEAVAQETLPPPPTPEQMEQALRAYEATVDRIETAVRSMDPGADRPPAMSFERMIQSLYFQALIQLGLTGDPNQPARVDLMGARSTIDMLGIIGEKTAGNLSDSEAKLIQAALFELHLGFLDVTQALAQQAAKRAPGEGMPPPPGGGPSLIR